MLDVHARAARPSCRHHPASWLVWSRDRGCRGRQYCNSNKATDEQWLTPLGSVEFPPSNHSGESSSLSAHPCRPVSLNTCLPLSALPTAASCSRRCWHIQRCCCSGDLLAEWLGLQFQMDQPVLLVTSKCCEMDVQTMADVCEVESSGALAAFSCRDPSLNRLTLPSLHRLPLHLAHVRCRLHARCTDSDAIRST